MATRTLRRRLHHGDLDGRKNEIINGSLSDSLDEPLLGNYNDGSDHSERYDDSSEQNAWDDKKKEQLHWTNIFSNLIQQWTQWLENILAGPGSVLGRFLSFPSAIQNGRPLYLNPLQEERLGALRERLQVPFDSSCVDHQNALKQLWKLAYPNREIPPLKSELWKEMGWQGTDPSTDFRGGGFISLENLIFFAKNYPEAFQVLLHKQEGKRAEWEYPFAVAGINISFMLIQMLNVQSGPPTSIAGVRFMEILGRDKDAFDNLYCVAFRMMDAQWLAKRASYMEFNDVLKSTRTQIERELALEDVTSVKDLPAYTMLNK